MKTIINNHNKNILEKKPSINISTCNYRNKKACSLNGQCQIGGVVYEVAFQVTNQITKKKKYFGIVEESFKGRQYSHNFSFRNGFYKKNYTPKITWRIIRK